jgi:hypothetical protein
MLEVPKNADSHLFGFVPIGIENSLPARPRSSPSTFSPTSGPRLEDMIWNANALGISSSTGPAQGPFRQSTYPGLQSPRTPRLSEPNIGAIVPQVVAPQPKKMYAPIAPNPQGLNAISRKRTLDGEDDGGSPEDAKRRKRSDSMATPTELTEEDKLLIKLKDEESLPWKDIAARFQSDLGKKYQIPALQMRLKRLRERLRVWTEQDVKALKMAHEYWIQNKYEIIASKVRQNTCPVASPSYVRRHTAHLASLSTAMRSHCGSHPHHCPTETSFHGSSILQATFERYLRDKMADMTSDG